MHAQPRCAPHPWPCSNPTPQLSAPQPVCEDSQALHSLHMQNPHRAGSTTALVGCPPLIQAGLHVHACIRVDHSPKEHLCHSVGHNKAHPGGQSCHCHWPIGDHDG